MRIASIRKIRNIIIGGRRGRYVPLHALLPPQLANAGSAAAAQALTLGNALGLLPQAIALNLAMERRLMLPTLHRWTSVSPRGPPEPRSKTKPRLACDFDPATEASLKDLRFPPTKMSIMSTDRFENQPSRPIWANFCRLEGVPEGHRLEKRAPNDADDAGPLGPHHQHH